MFSKKVIAYDNHIFNSIYVMYTDGFEFGYMRGELVRWRVCLSCGILRQAGWHKLMYAKYALTNTYYEGIATHAIIR